MPASLKGPCAWIFSKLLQTFWTVLIILRLVWRFFRVGTALYERKQHDLPKKLLTDYMHNHATLPTGIKIHYVEAGINSNPLMLFVHGFPEFWYSWRYQLEHFKEKYRVVAIDQRGYGDSDRPKDIGEYHVDKLAQDVEDLIHVLGHSTAVVVGHDWGGAVVWRHAMRFPETVDRLVVMNLPHEAVLEQLLNNGSGQLLRSWYMFFFQTPWLPEFMIASEDFKMLEETFWGQFGLRNKEKVTGEDLEAWKATFSAPGALTAAIDYYRCAMKRPESEPRDMIIKPRILLLWGEEEAFLMREGAEESMKASIPLWCRNGQLHYVKNACHFVQQDAPEEVNQIMEEFLVDLGDHGVDNLKKH